jgi:hypothetical protein
MVDWRRSALVLVALCGSLTVLTAQAPRPPARPAVAAPKPASLTQEQLFQVTTIWTADLTFTRDQWAAMQPTRGKGRGGNGEWLQGSPGERNGWGAANGVAFQYAHADLEFAGQKFRDVGVRFKGNGTYMDAAAPRSFPSRSISTST